VDVVRDKRLAQNLDDRDRRADARLEAELDACGRRGAEQLRAATSDQLLVRRDDRPAGAQECEDVLEGRLDSTHDFGDERDRWVMCDVLECGRQGDLAGRKSSLAFGIADERADDLEAVAGRALDVVAVLVQQAVDGGADRSVTEQRNRDFDGGHEPMLPPASAGALLSMRGEDEHGAKTAFRAAPQILDDVAPGNSHHVGKCRGDEDRVIQLSGHRDEVRNEVERHHEVCQQRDQRQLRPARDSRVSQQPLH
jgi:hypothetical protein